MASRNSSNYRRTYRYLKKICDAKPIIYLTTAIRDKEFIDFFKTHPVKVVVEVGTYKGMSAAYIANFAKTVYTFDIKGYKATSRIWKALKLNKKIRRYIVKSREEMTGIINKLDFDFAFIDGSHLYDDVKADFELVKKCGRVLFHDVSLHPEGLHDDIRRFIAEIGNVKIIGNIGYWNANRNNNNI